MKKGLSLLLCVLLIAASAASYRNRTAYASANSVTNDSFSLDFESGSTPFDGTAMWSDAAVQEFSSNAVSGNKSLYLEAEGDWCYPCGAKRQYNSVGTKCGFIVFLLNTN